MAARPSAYVSFKESTYRITIDFRLHAPSDVPIDVILNEASLSYVELLEKIKNQWKGNKG